MKKYFLTQLENGWTITESKLENGQEEKRKFIAGSIMEACAKVLELNPQQEQADA